MVFSTKNREPWLEDDIQSRLWPYLAKAVQGENGIALIINGLADHVHLLVKLHQDCKVSAFLRAIKANSSGWLHREFPKLRAFAWQTGYGAFTVSASQVEKARRYIANQKQHHRKMSFQEEFRALLRSHGIDFDERYLWD